MSATTPPRDDCGGGPCIQGVQGEDVPQACGGVRRVGWFRKVQSFAEGEPGGIIIRKEAIRPTGARRSHPVTKEEEMEAQQIRIVFDGPPGPESGRFVEVEDMDGCSLSVGDWRPIEGTEYWGLYIDDPREIARLTACMKRAGLECFDRDGTPEQVADHMHKISASSLASEAALKLEVARLTSKTYCAYCGAEFALDDNAASAVSAHIAACDKHPMRQLRSNLATAILNCQKYELLFLERDLELAAAKAEVEQLRAAIFEPGGWEERCKKDEGEVRRLQEEIRLITAPRESVGAVIAQLRADLAAGQAHRGDPCVYCGTPHDDVAIGPCPANRDVLREQRDTAHTALATARRDGNRNACDLCHCCGEQHHDGGEPGEHVEARIAKLEAERAQAMKELSPACAGETLVGAIRNLQQAYISAQGNADTLEARLEVVVRAANNVLRWVIGGPGRDDLVAALSSPTIAPLVARRDAEQVVVKAAQRFSGAHATCRLCATEETFGGFPKAFSEQMQALKALRTALAALDRPKLTGKYVDTDRVRTFTQEQP